jgi:hypothetical protein
MSHSEQKLHLFPVDQSRGDIIFQNSDVEMFLVNVDIVDDRPGLQLRVFNDFDDLLKRQRTFQD